jgi:hypothetical protein
VLLRLIVSWFIPLLCASFLRFVLFFGADTEPELTLSDSRSGGDIAQQLQEKASRIFMQKARSVPNLVEKR